MSPPHLLHPPLPPPSRLPARSFKEGHVSSLVLDWLKRHIQVNHDRLEEAVENDVNLLYLHSDNTLHDCIECNDNDDSAALNNSEIIQVNLRDYT